MNINNRMKEQLEVILHLKNRKQSYLINNQELETVITTDSIEVFLVSQNLETAQSKVVKLLPLYRFKNKYISCLTFSIKVYL